MATIQRSVPVGGSVVRSAFVVLLVGCIFAGRAGAQTAEGFRVLHPYANRKPYPYRASLHNHSAYHPEYSHAACPSDQRLRHYRDAETEPKYGIVSITEHTRITTPWTTVPSGGLAGSNAPWGVEGILWLPGNETLIGNARRGGIYGELLIIGASTEQTDEPDWTFSEHKLARSGWISTSRPRAPEASVELTFRGVGIRWIARQDETGGIGAVYLDGVRVGEADLYATTTAYGREVFALTEIEDREHILRLTYERRGQSVRQSDMGWITLDTLLVMKSDGTTEEYGAKHPALTYQPRRFMHAWHPRGEGRGVEEPLRLLREDGCFLVLAHPNFQGDVADIRDASGRHTHRQEWTGTGYTRDELEVIFGNPEKGIAPLRHLPHALEIGNAVVDLSERFGFENAEAKWDELLGQGHQLMGIASDDSHGAAPFEGWIVVYAVAATREALTRDDVMDSLLSGQFYSSQGPSMEIDVSGNRFTVQTDPPALIEFISRGKVIHHATNTRTATYLIQGDEGYVRGRVTREDPAWRPVGAGIGRRRSAWTNPLYVVPAPR